MTVAREPRRAKSDVQTKTRRRRATSAALAPKLTRTGLFFAVTLFVSAALLFAVQPMFAKMVLPLLGGAAAVWNTCLVFYQAVLLAGYLYAHLSLRWLGPRRQAALHLLLLCVPWTVLPISVAQGWIPPPEVFPVVWLWMLLSVSVGLPFLVVSASAPMLQVWFSQAGGRSGRDPYFLYAASNLGSLLALLGYPLVIESHLTLREQTWGWAAGYGLLMVLVGGCAVQLWRSSPADTAEQTAVGGRAKEPVAERPNLRRRLHWLALSFVPSSLLLGVTTYISTDIAAIPFLWVLPLALYLSTFVLVFARRPILPLSWMLRVEVYLIVAAAGALAWRADAPSQLFLIGSLQLLTFFVIAMACHGQLAGDHPAGSHLTEFYLWMSLGGVLGGLFNALLAPLLFSGAVEYPLMIAVACLLRPRMAAPYRDLRAWVRGVGLPVSVLLICGGLILIVRSRTTPMEWGYADISATKLALVVSAVAAAFFLRRRPLQFGLGVAALLGVSLGYPTGKTQLLLAERSFFGLLRVTEDPLWNAHELLHGSTSHGCQSMDPKERHEPWTYYSRMGPLGRIFRALQPRRPLAEIGVLGLGTGTVAAYGQPGERITFYEIDPAVERIARNPQYFTYLTDCLAKVEVVLGDARLSLVHGPPRKFDLLIVDVFSSDSVPVHLITREALKVYFQRLADHGLLAIHISSRFLNLRPIVGRVAKDAGVTARLYADLDLNEGPNKWASVWVVIARRAEDLGPLAGDSAGKPLAAAGERVWTDDFSNVVAALPRQVSWDWLQTPLWRTPQNEAAFHAQNGVALAKQGRYDEAIGQLQLAVEINPDDSYGHNNLGWALQPRGRIDEAMTHFQRALKIRPRYPEAHHGLGITLALRGRLEEAITHYRKALELKPDYAEAHDSLGNALRGCGRTDEAVAHYQKALELNPLDATAHRGLAEVLAGRGQVHEAIIHYKRALTITPQNVAACNNLAWLFATCPDAAVRDGAKAIALAQRAVKLSGHKDPDFLDTLAAAYAEAARFPEALATVREALELARQQNKPALADVSAGANRTLPNGKTLS